MEQLWLMASVCIYNNTRVCLCVMYLCVCEIGWPCVCHVCMNEENSIRYYTRQINFSFFPSCYLLINGRTTTTQFCFADELLTVALRPTFLYGEEDPLFLTSIIKVAHQHKNQVPKIAGQGGKQQLTYVGKGIL